MRPAINILTVYLQIFEGEAPRLDLFLWHALTHHSIGPGGRGSASNTRRREVKYKLCAAVLQSPTPASSFPYVSGCPFSTQAMLLAPPSTILSLLFLLLLLHYCHAVSCNPPPSGIMPLIADCTEVVQRILDIARLPGAAASKEWGRKLNNTDTTVHLPKTYWIAGAGPKTCAVYVDIAKGHPPGAVERFGFQELGHAAERVLDVCLAGKGEVGEERVGAERGVGVRLARVNRGFLNAAGRTRVGVVSGKRRLWWTEEVGSRSVAVS